MDLARIGLAGHYRPLNPSNDANRVIGRIILDSLAIIWIGYAKEGTL